MQIWRSNTLPGNAHLFCIAVCLPLTSFNSLINTLPDTLQAALDEVKRSTNFNAFMITGGPCAMGTASFYIFLYVFSLGLCFQYSSFDRVQTGYSIRDGESFEEYLGPMFKSLKDKYWEWLNKSYSTCDSTTNLKSF